MHYRSPLGMQGLIPIYTVVHTNNLSPVSSSKIVTQVHESKVISFFENHIYFHLVLFYVSRLDFPVLKFSDKSQLYAFRTLFLHDLDLENLVGLWP